MSEVMIDMFCGRGGVGVGAEEGIGRFFTIAINHSYEAIRIHKYNHPFTNHLTEDVFTIDLRKHLKPGDKVRLLWASPDCTSHSKALGGKPREKGLRILPWSVYKICLQILEVTGNLPEVILMENVEEIQKWGPLGKDYKTIKELEGMCYRCFTGHMSNGEYQADGRPEQCSEDMCKHCNECIVTKEGYSKSLGFEFDSRELVAADFGAPTIRKRWHGQFRSDGRKIAWPAPTHSKDGKNGLQKWIPISTCLDWSDLGSSIFTRNKPLKEKTLNRIARGIEKFIINSPNPYFLPEKEAAAFLIQYHGETNPGNVRGQSLNEPIKTIDTANRYGLVTAFITKFYKTGTGQSVNEPIHTITTSPGHFGLVSAFLIKYYGSSIGQSVNDPIGTIVTKDRFGLVTVMIQGEPYQIVDIWFRMLKPEELKLGQSFPKDYVIDRDYKGKKCSISKQVEGIGNSVAPKVAAAIISASCGYLKSGERMPNMEIDDSQPQLRFA